MILSRVARTLVPWLAVTSAVGVAALNLAGGPAEGVMLWPRQTTTTNLQPFAGAEGGLSAPAITRSEDPERPFQVGDDTFPDFQSAASRACDEQKNACAEQVNSGGEGDVGACDGQNDACKTAAQRATATAFNELVTADDEFEIFCDL